MDQSSIFGKGLSNNNQRPMMANREPSSESIQSSIPVLPTTTPKAESVFNLDTVYKNNTRYATQSVLPPDNYSSPYYIPFKNIDDPRPVDQLIYRFSIWKMIIKQIVFYFKEMCVFKSQTFQGNRAMLENLEILRRQNSGRLKVKASSNKNLKKSLSATNIKDEESLSSTLSNNGSCENLNLSDNENLNFDQQNIVNKLLQTTFLPPGDNSILSISSTFFNNHNYLKEKELLTYQHLSNRLIPRLENLKDQLNETIRQMNSIKNSSDFKTKNLKMEIAKTGGILSDYITSIELLKTGHSKSSLGTTITLKKNEIDPKLDPYILKLKLDLQLKDQLYIEAHLKEMYYDLQFKAVQLEKILYSEIQSCISTYTDLIDSELNSVKDNLILPFKQGFIKNDPTIDWDYFIKNDNKKNFLPINSKTTLNKTKQVRKNSDIAYPYRNNVISSCIYSGYLEKKSKYLKNYSKFYYVLTINFLHEFRSSDRIKDLNPIQSFSMSDLTVSGVENDPKKFVIRIYKNDAKESSKSKFTFKCDSIDSTLKWIDYLSDLTEFGNTIERNVSYDLSDDEDDQEHSKVNNQSDQSSFVDSRSLYFSNGLTSPPIDAHSLSPLTHSRSASDEFYKAPYQQLQNCLSQKSPQDDHFSINSNNSNINSIAFKSIKSQPNMLRQTSASTVPNSTASETNSRTSSRTSSRASSRTSSPVGRNSTIRNIAAPRPSNTILSPKIGTVTTPNGSTTSSGDYFSYAPRKVQASIIRNGNRLASSSSSGRITPTGSLSLNTSNTGLSSNISLNKSTSNLSIPRINIHESSPINTEKPDLDFKLENINNEQVSGLERRRKTLSEKLDLTGLVSANSTNTSSTILNLPATSDSLNSSFGLPQTPGIIPGSKMNQVFDIKGSNAVHNDSIHEDESEC